MEDDLWDSIQEHLNNPPPPEVTLLTEEETDALILSFVGGRGEKGATEEEVYNFIRWVELIRVSNSFIELAIKGLVYIDDHTGEFAPGSEVHARLTELGEKSKDLLT